ncbi:hypothetical protein [Rhizobium sp. CF080]|uniref:hypothetical protein n=1 Tax=Rhizobium sp. (strain CF080) TaxID=1144310 RepID=UPI0012DF4B7A|nr:hypothetical protein [Rhizobium sp. CF080]
MEYKKAKIWWAEGKAALPTKSLRYITVAKFDEDTDKGTDVWSVVVEFESSEAVTETPAVCKIKFLAEGGPETRLSTGKILKLYEGRTLSATVVIM